MEPFFLTLLEVSGGTAAVILPVALLSNRINRTYTAKWKYWLWLALAIRLLIPVNLAPPSAPAQFDVSIPNATIVFQAPAPGNAARSPSAGAARGDGQMTAPPAERGVTTMELLMLLWAFGAVVFVAYQGGSYAIFLRKVLRWGRPVGQESGISDAMRRLQAELGIKATIRALVCGNIASPMMLGFAKPTLVLPKDDYDEPELYFILRHELTHFQRGDLRYKALMLLANAVHWFNPAVWLMVREASRDLEISCDAAVIEGAGMERRKQYGETILACVHKEAARHTALSTHFYGGKRTLKERFGNILNTKKRKAGVVLFIALLLCAGIAGGLVACSAKAAAPTQEEVVELLQKAEAVYQLGNQDVLTIAQYELQPSGDQLYYDEISNYERAVAEIFTENGIAQLEQSSNLGVPLILKQDGKVYRASAMADSAATVYYGAIKSVTLLEETNERFVYEIVHIAEPRGFDPAADTAPELTDRAVLIKKNQLLLVEDFSYPLNIAEEDPAETAADEFAAQNAALQERYQRLLDEDNFALLKLLEARMAAYRDGTFVEMPNHHPNWPDDFPSPALVPQPLTMQDFVIRTTPFVKIDENSYWDGSIFVWVRIDDTHWLTLEPAWFGHEDTDELTLGFGGSGFYEGDLPFDFAAAVEQQTLDVLLLDASVFTSGSGDSIEVATAGVRHYYETFMGENVPKNCRITEYTIRSVTLVAYGGTEFMVRVVSDYATTGSYFLSANGNFIPYGENTASSGGVCTDDTKEFRFMSDGDERYHIVSVGTGGGGAGLTPVESPLEMEAQAAAPHIEMTGVNSIYFSNLDIIPEFSSFNEGGATYNPQKNTLEVGVIKSTGTTTGAIEGPALRFIVDLSGDGGVLEREYSPQPDSPLFQQTRPDNGELAEMSDARLVEAARAIYALMLEQSGHPADGA